MTPRRYRARPARVSEVLMAEQATDSPHLLPRALAEPTEPVTKGWIGSLGLASLVMWMASLTPLQVLIPDQLQHIDRHGKILALGLVSAFGAVASLLATPIAGALSDRTTHAYGLAHLRGRRHRWTLAMAILSAFSLALIAWQPTVLGVGIFWVLFSAFQNGEYASLSAAVPDHVPVNQRATVAGWIGMPQALGLVVGTALVVYVFNGPISGYLAIGMGTLYLLYFLQDAVHYHRLFPSQNASQGLFILIVIYTGFVVVTAIVGGVISDRIGKRKMIVTISGGLMGAAALLLTFEETWPAAMIAAVLFGAGFGAYLAVDQALITQVLPEARDRAKDLGIINIAIVGPAAVAGAIAAVLVSVGGYPALFGATAVVAAVGSVLVWKIKSVP